MPGTVLVSAGTYNLVKELFEFNPRGPTTIKGKTAPIVTYEVLSQGRARQSAWSGGIDFAAGGT